jgi:hypothetical protein
MSAKKPLVFVALAILVSALAFAASGTEDTPSGPATGGFDEPVIEPGIVAY